MICRRILPILIAASPLVASAEIIVGKDGILLDHTLVEGATKADESEKTKTDPAGDDLVLFNNGDLMHGTFGGINEGLLWERKDIDRHIKFGLPSIKQIVFKSTRRLKLEEKSSFITLSSGDRIPGKILSLDDKNLSLKSPVIGEVTIPRNLIRSIAPNPFDGELHYIGPYTSEGWFTLGPKEKENEEKKDEAEDDKKEKDKKPTPSSWIHSGTSFYSQNTEPLIFADANLPDTGRISFNISWKGRLSIALALHSDLIRVLPPIEEVDEDEEEANDEEVDQADIKKEEEPEEAEEEPAPLVREKVLDLRKGTAFQSIPWINPSKQSHTDLFGTGYTLTLQSGYPTLTRNLFTKSGSPVHERLSTTRSTSSLSENDEAQIEIRFDRKKALIMLFINGVYASQWNDLSGYPGEGTALGFMNRTSSSKIRISELVISSWAGSTDSARSMEHPERDIAILTNGTDRFSGALSHINDGLAHLETGYSKIQIPLQDLSMINFNKDSLLDLEAEENTKRFQEDEDSITVIYQPYGLIKLSPTSATANSLTGQSPFLGKIHVDLDPAVLLRFSNDSPDLSDWFDKF